MHLLDWRNFFSEIKNKKLSSFLQPYQYPWDVIKNISGFFLDLTSSDCLNQVTPNVKIENPDSVFISNGVSIEPFAVIRGPCFIGEGAQIRQGAYVRGNVFIGNGCVVGHNTEIKNSILLDGASASHFNYVGDSILGHHVNIGAGVILANVRLDRKNIIARGPSVRIDTGMKKLGAILGDGVQIGCNAVLNPGSFFGKNSLCPPCINAGGFTLEKTTFKKQ